MSSRTSLDGRCGWCGKLLPPPRPTPDGAWPAPPRRYCNETCRNEAAKQRRREEAATPTSRAVLEAAAKAGLVLTPDACARQLATMGPAIAAGVRRHEEEITSALRRAYEMVGGYPLGDDLAGRAWLACDACGEGQLYTPKAIGRRCGLRVGCPGRMVVLVQPALVKGARPCA
jgi:hypothetical protein